MSKEGTRDEDILISILITIFILTIITTFCITMQRDNTFYREAKNVEATYVSTNTYRSGRRYHSSMIFEGSDNVIYTVDNVSKNVVEYVLKNKKVNLLVLNNRVEINLDNYKNDRGNISPATGKPYPEKLKPNELFKKQEDKYQ